VVGEKRKRKGKDASGARLEGEREESTAARKERKKLALDGTWKEKKKKREGKVLQHQGWVGGEKKKERIVRREGVEDSYSAGCPAGKKKEGKDQFLAS